MAKVNNALVITEGIRPYPAKERNERIHEKPQAPRRLVTREEVGTLLALNGEQVNHLVNTRQITRIRIAGEERFDFRDIDGLIEAYKSTAQRRAAQ